MMDKITLIKSISPEKVCKTYSLINGDLKKEVIANVTKGKAVTIDVSTAQAMAKILNRVSERADLVVCPGVWRGSELGQSFDVLSEKALASVLDVPLQDVPGGVIEHNGELVSARLKRGIDYSSWMLLDADNPPGIPDDWASMSIAQRLELWEPFVPGITKCERIELRGSSARVVQGDEIPNATHAWIRVSHPNKISELKAHIRVQMVLQGASFTFEKVSKLDGTVVGEEDRSVFDLAVMDTGRLVFCAKPDVHSDVHSVIDAGITLHNEGGGVLDISGIELPKPRALEDLRRKTGVMMSMTRSGDTIHTIVTGELTMDTPIEVQGRTRRLADWAATMSPQDKMRCESPFRVSQSESAFIRLGANGEPFVHDIGNGTTYKMQRTITKREPFSVVEGGYGTDDQTPSTDEKTESADKDHAGFDEWVFLTRRGVFRNVSTGEEVGIQAFNTAFSRDVPKIMLEGKTVRPTPAKYLLDQLNGRRAHDYMYHPPLANEECVFEHEGVYFVNSYMTHRVPKCAPDWRADGAWKVCQDHLKNILPSDWETLLAWMAHNVQKPGEKILWAPIIKGIQGDGKSTIARMIGAAMGHHNVRMIATEELQSDFNSWAEGACVGVLEEIRIRGHNRHDAMNKLKPLVTNEKISVVRKGQDGRNIPNVTNYLALTNHEDALVLDADDRRYGVFFTRFKNRDEMVSATGSDYWVRLNDAINNHLSIVRSWLKNVDLSKFDARDAPAMTDAKAFMINQSKSEDEDVIEEAIALGGFGVSAKVVATDCLTSLVREHGSFAPKGKRLSNVLTQMGFHKVDAPIKWRSKTRRVYVADKALVDNIGANRDSIKWLLDDTYEEVGF